MFEQHELRQIETLINTRVSQLETFVNNLINPLKGSINKLMLDITALTTAVANETTVEQSAITLLGGLSAELQTLINDSGNTVDPVALQGLVDKMNASQTALAAAVTANTPVPTSTPAAPPATPAPATPSGT